MMPGQQNDFAEALANALADASGLASGLLRMRAGALGSASARADAEALASDVDHASALAAALASRTSLELVGTRSLARDIDVVLVRGRELVSALGREFVSARACADASARAAGEARAIADGADIDAEAEIENLAAAEAAAEALAVAEAGAAVAAEALDAAEVLAGALTTARELATALMPTVYQVAELGGSERSVPPGARSRRRVKARRVAPSACRLTIVAAWLLPAGQRARYGEEYRSELYDLAAGGAGRRQQLGYALRLLGRAGPLRLAVLAPRRGKASP